MPIDVPGYEVIRSIAHEGVAELTLVKHPVFGNQVVLKRFDTLGLEDALAFLEPQLLHDFKHENIAPIYDATTENQGVLRTVTIHMPYYEVGSVFDSLMTAGPFSIGTAVSLGRDVLSALSHAHDTHRVVHRDVKPANILLAGATGPALLSDFGSAARMNAAGQARVSLGRSPLYQPPEQESGVQGDIYSTGMTLFEMLNGPFPYEDLDYQHVVERLNRGLRALPNRMFRHRPWVPRQLRAVVNRAINSDPQLRQQTATEFRAQLTRSRFVDWQLVDGEPPEAVWEGEWVGRSGADHYRLETMKVRGARVRVRPTRGYPSGWRAFGIGQAIAPLEDAERVLEDVFNAVLVAAANHRPA